MSANTVKKILNHVEKDKIIGKLINGESAKDVAEYLKLKFSDTDQAHLRLSQGALSEFRNKYLAQYKSLDQVLQDDNTKELDKKVFKSLAESKEWHDFQIKELSKDIDLKKKIMETLARVEARAEQVFDSIQQHPERVNGKTDYVLIKYMELIGNLIDKADKIVNEKPDQVVQHNVSIQMVEQHSYAFQEAIRELMVELDPDMASRLMDLITDKLSKLQDPESAKPKRSLSQTVDDAHRLEAKLDDPDDILSQQQPKNKNVLDAEFDDGDNKNKNNNEEK